MAITTSEALADYEKAYKLGKKEGGIPLVLDEILKERASQA